MSDKRAPGRPIAPPRLSLAQTIEALRKGLDPQPARVAVYAARAALHHLELAQAQDRETWDLRHIKDLYATLVTEHNAIWEAARARGIEVFQPFGSDDWHWDNGQRRGVAPTPAEALLAALDDKPIIV